MSLRKLALDLLVEIDPSWRPLDRLQVFTDFGTGTIDTDRPLIFRPRRIFPADSHDRVRRLGYGEEPYGLQPYGAEGAVVDRVHGYGWDPYGEVEYGGTTKHVVVPVEIPQAYGTWKFAAQTIDGAGNEQGALTEFSRFVSGENPPPLASFVYTSYDSGSDKLTFTFTV